MLAVISPVVLALVCIRLIAVWVESGVTGVVKALLAFLLTLPGMRSLLNVFTQKEIKGFVKETFSENQYTGKELIPIPEEGISIEVLKEELAALKGNKNLSQEGKLFAYVYTDGGDNSHFEIQKEAFRLYNTSEPHGQQAMEERNKVVNLYFEAFMHDNALNPVIFPSLRKFENEIVSMTAHMLHGDGNTVGSVTSGGSESLLMAVKTYRDFARKKMPHVAAPNIVAPSSLHPAFDKAGQYFNVEIKHVEVDPVKLVCNLTDLEAAIDENTILIAASAPSYPQAIMDQIEEISKIATKYNLPFHVDACYGGFMTPWLEKLGHKIPPWDYRLPGVTSISADIHKYGYATKGASVITYKNEAIRKFQFFAYSKWSGGLFASPTMAGTRPGGHLAASWAVLRRMGQNGYMEMAEKVFATAEKMRNGIREIEGLEVLGNPIITGFGFGSTDKRFTVYQIADEMEKKGWKTEVQMYPDSIHCTVVPSHVRSCDKWLSDLKDAVANLKANPVKQKSGVSAMYGMLGLVPENAIIDDFLIDLFSDIYRS